MYSFSPKTSALIIKKKKKKKYPETEQILFTGSKKSTNWILNTLIIMPGAKLRRE